jgi:hypothetical protein
MWMKKSYSPGKGIAAGLIGGLIASWVMDLAIAGMKKAAGRFQEENQDAEGQSAAQGGQQEWQRAAGREEESATVKTAVAISENIFHQELPAEKKETAGQLVHYGYGGAIGALYGWVAEGSGLALTGAGTLFGAALWLAGDEIGVPMLGLSKPPQEYPLSTHATALGAHLVYGATTELVRRALRRGYLSS